MVPRRDPAIPGQESVWDYPRPAVAELSRRHLRIVHRGRLIAETRRSLRTLETSHPPTYYFPAGDVSESILVRSEHVSFCEWKGSAVYFNVRVDGEVLGNAAWSYPAPTGEFVRLRDCVAFYAAPFETCLVDGECVKPQPGGFYGGWITSNEAGPFKGVPGSRFW